MDVLKFLALVMLAGVYSFFAYAWMECEKEKEKLKKLLEEERKKLHSQSESRQRAERELSLANAFIEKLKAQNKELDASLNKLWEDTARLRKPTGAGPKKSHGDF